ncbi:MAG: helix-turn-helix domain-containing protein [Spirochaetaceae bacterium]|nr:helix-turn-helix domain-containing protein [Spirochaetaceae bacterium]
MSNKIALSDPKSRDREHTERRLISAAKSIMEKRGLDSVGINAVAEEAGVSKVLIYRYFGGLEGLMERVGQELDSASIRGVLVLVEKGLNQGMPIPEILRDTVPVLRKKLLADELSMNLMAWEMMNENDLTRAFSRAREEAGIELNGRISQEFPSGSNFDVEAAFAVISSSIYYLLLRSRHVEEYGGINLRTDSGWERLAAVMADMLEGLMD